MKSNNKSNKTNVTNHYQTKNNNNWGLKILIATTIVLSIIISKDCGIIPNNWEVLPLIILIITAVLLPNDNDEEDIEV